MAYKTYLTLSRHCPAGSHSDYVISCPPHCRNWIFPIIFSHLVSARSGVSCIFDTTFHSCNVSVMTGALNPPPPIPRVSFTVNSALGILPLGGTCGYVETICILIASIFHFDGVWQMTRMAGRCRCCGIPGLTFVFFLQPGLITRHIGLRNTRGWSWRWRKMNCIRASELQRLAFLQDFGFFLVVLLLKHLQITLHLIASFAVCSASCFSDFHICITFAHCHDVFSSAHFLRITRCFQQSCILTETTFKYGLLFIAFAIF